MHAVYHIRKAQETGRISGIEPKIAHSRPQREMGRCEPGMHRNQASTISSFLLWFGLRFLTLVLLLRRSCLLLVMGRSVRHRRVLHVRTLSSRTARNQRKRPPLSHFQEHASVKTKRPGIRHSGWCKNKKSAEPRPLPQPPRRGTVEQHMADAPFGARLQVAASTVQEPLDSGSRFCGKQFLTLARQFKFSGSIYAAGALFLFLLVVVKDSPKQVGGSSFSLGCDFSVFNRQFRFTCLFFRDPPKRMSTRA